jgi:hypothetical protein
VSGMGLRPTRRVAVLGLDLLREKVHPFCHNWTVLALHGVPDVD